MEKTNVSPIPSLIWSLAFIALILSAPTAHATEMTVERAFQVIGVLQGTSWVEVKAKRNLLLKKYHTDRAGDGTLAQVQEINVAFDILKKWYDSASSATTQAQAKPTTSKPETKLFFRWNPLSGKISTNVTFTAEDVLQRKGHYKAVLSFLSGCVTTDLDDSYHSPFRLAGISPLRARMQALKQNPYALGVVGGIASTCAAMTPYSLLAGAATPFVALGVEEFFYHSALRQERSSGEALGLQLGAILYSLIESSIGVGSYPSFVMSYDVAEEFAHAKIQIPLSTKWLYYSKFIQIIDSVPDALAGFLLRASAGQRIAGRLSEQLKTDIRARPKFWRQVFARIPYFDLPQEYRGYPVLKDLYIASVSTPRAPDWNARMQMKAHVMCEMLF